MIDDIWKIGGQLVYAVLVVFVVAAVYATVSPLIYPSDPLSQIIEFAESMGALALGLLVGSLFLTASVVLDKLDTFGGSR